MWGWKPSGRATATPTRPGQGLLGGVSQAPSRGPLLSVSVGEEVLPADEGNGSHREQLLMLRRALGTPLVAWGGQTRKAVVMDVER